LPLRKSKSNERHDDQNLKAGHLALWQPSTGYASQSALSAEETLLLKMAQNVDARKYYGYLFEADKKPTQVLDALLRGIAIYIVSCDQMADYAPCHHRETSKLTVASQSTSIGNTEQKKLTPDKLATFYKAVGGNYDCLCPSNTSHFAAQLANDPVPQPSSSKSLTHPSPGSTHQ
jgi:hypothetical protein